MTNAFDDLDDSDTSSMNNSHYQDSSKEVEVSNTVLNSAQGVIASKDQTVSQLQKEFGIYDHVENSNNYGNTMTNHRPEFHITPSISNMQRDFNAYDHTDTPYSNNNRSNDMHNITAETPYELARPPNSMFPKDLRVQLEEEHTFNENYSYNYQTPANHYDAQSKNYSNNGFIDGYENNVQCKQIHEFGGGDNITSDHVNHCYKASSNGRPTDDLSLIHI